MLSTSLESQPIQLPTNTPGARFQRHQSVLTDIYESAINMAVWQRAMDRGIHAYVNELINKPFCFHMRLVISKNRIKKALESDLPSTDHRQTFISDLEFLIDMFSSLFDLGEVGLRLAVLAKGEAWTNSEGFGLVHRSPQASLETKRLLLTLDFSYKNLSNSTETSCPSDQLFPGLVAR